MAAWLFNPFTSAISTRGNGESLVSVVLLRLLQHISPSGGPGCTLCTPTSPPCRGFRAGTPSLIYPGEHLGGPAVLSTAAAGALFGLATHWRLYPIIYGLPILLYLQLQRPMAVRLWSSPQRDGIVGHALGQLSAAWPAQGVACFSAAAAAAFLGLGAACYAAFGHAFLENAYMYHGRRIDPRHNFSPASHCLRPAVCLEIFKRVTVAQSRACMESARIRPYVVLRVNTNFCLLAVSFGCPLA